MARRVDDVDGMLYAGEILYQPILSLLPVGRNGRRSNGNASFALLIHPVSHRVAIIHITNAVGKACIEQNPLRRRRLARVDMRSNPDVSGTLQRERTLWRVYCRLVCFQNCLHFTNTHPSASINTPSRNAPGWF